MTMTQEQITKARQMLAKEVADRKVYADALEAVNALEGLATTKAELEAAVDALKIEKAEIDVMCDKAADTLKAMEDKAKQIATDAENEAASVVNAAHTKAKEIEQDHADKITKAIKAHEAVLADIEAASTDLCALNEQIAEANKTLEAIREKLKGI